MAILGCKFQVNVYSMRLGGFLANGSGTLGLEWKQGFRVGLHSTRMAESLGAKGGY